MKKKYVLHIPEECAYNSFIQRTREIQEGIGITVLRLNICNDGGNYSNYNLELVENLPENIIENLMIHFHWPEKLYCRMNEDELIQWIKKMKRRGVKFVKTIHNLKPHEDMESKESTFVNLMDGITFFSNAQMQYYKKNNAYDGIMKVIPHPNYRVQKIETVDEIKANQDWNLLCIGRVRAYKQFDIICDVLKKLNNKNIHISVVGKPDDMNTVEIIEDYAKKDSRLGYCFRFLSEEDVVRYFSDADMMLLPYGQVWSSGMAILCANLGKPIIGKMPYMFRDYDAEKIGVFDTTFKDLDSDKLIELLKESMDYGKSEMKLRAQNLHHLCNENSDEVIGNLYDTFYSEVLVANIM